MDDLQISLIVDAIKKKVDAPETYKELLQLVKDFTVLNTKVLMNQDELERALSEDLIPMLTKHCSEVASLELKKIIEEVCKVSRTVNETGIITKANKFFDEAERIKLVEKIDKIVPKVIIAFFSIFGIFAAAWGFVKFVTRSG